MKKRKRLFAMLLALAMALTVLPVSAYSGLALDGPCPNHPVHDAGCGYVEGESPCLHICEKCATPERLHELDSTLDEEIAALEEAYFGDAPAELTPEYQEALMSLYATLSENGGMTVSLPARSQAQTGIATEQVLPEGAIFEPNLKISVPEPISVTNGTASAAGNVTLNFTLSKAVDYEVSFRLRVLEGSAREGVNYALSGSGESGSNVLKAAETTITFPAGTTAVTKVLDILNDTSKGTGARYLYLLYDQPRYAVFDGTGAGKYSDHTQITINMNNAYDLSPFQETVNSIRWDFNTQSGQQAYQFPQEDPAVSGQATPYEVNGHPAWRVQSNSDPNWGEGSGGGGMHSIFSDLQESMVRDSWSTHTLTEAAKQVFRDGIANKLVFEMKVNVDDGRGKWCRAGYISTQWGNDEDIQAYWDSDHLFNQPPPWEQKHDLTGNTQIFARTLDLETEKTYAGDTFKLYFPDMQLKLYLEGYVIEGITTVDYYLSAVDIHAHMVDDKAPTFVDFHVPAGDYSSGDVIPVTAEFSEPVTGDITLNLVEGGLSLKQQEAWDIQSKYRTYLYTVQERNNTVITVKSLTSSDARDLIGNSFARVGSYDSTVLWMAENESRTLTEANIVTPIEKLAFADGAGSMTAVYPKKTDGSGSWDSYIRTDTGRIEMKLNYSADTALDLTNWLASEYSDTGKLSRVKLSLDGGRSFYDVTYAADEAGDAIVDTLVCEFPVSDLEAGTYQAALWMADAPGTDGSLVFYPVLNGSAQVQVTQADVTAIALSGAYGSENTQILPKNPGETPSVLLSELMGEGTVMPPITFTASLTPERVSYPSVTWKVENADPSVESPIAEITRDADDPLKAQLNLTGNAFGQVKVTATADNGGAGKAVTQTFTFEIVRDISLFVGSATTVKVGEGGPIRWMNSDGDIYKDAVYEVKLYEADENGEPSGSPIRTYTSQPGANSVEAEEGIFQKMSAFDSEKGAYRPAYVAVITTPDLYNIGKTLEARADITVYPRQVGVSLKPAVEDVNGGLYILDDAGTFEFEGTVENWTDRVPENWEVSVTRNGEALPASAYSCSADGDAVKGQLTISPVEEGGLKDIYIITVKAKNHNTAIFSSDSLLLQVYDREALAIVVENEKGQIVDTLKGTEGEITLSNKGEAALHDQKLDISTAAMEEILALKRQIDLKKYLYVNYEGIGWNTVSDRMEWNSSNSDAASVNYRNGSLYEDIRNFDYVNYRPDEVMMLVGHDDGETTISVTHGRTGNLVSFDVAVETLKDQLYLFQIYPAGQATVTYSAYTDASRTDTVERVAATNEKGEFAVYEEFGISSDVRFERTDENGSTWLGTIFHQDLLTQENDGSKLELYPLNDLEMREVTVQNFFLQDEDGNPYSGPVRYSYGVYKNGEFCPQARVSDDKGSPEHARDKAEAVSDENGLFTLRLDSTQFVTESELQAGVETAELSPEDEITFIVELEFGEDDYTQFHPKVVELDANVNQEQAVQSADSILNLVPTVEKYKGFVDSYRVQYKDEMRASYDATYNTGYVGLSNEFQDVDLKSRIIWWNAAKEDLDSGSLYGADVTDAYEKLLGSQKSSTQVYPFGWYPVTTNVLTLTPEVFDGKSVVDEDFEPISGQVRLYDQDGSLYASYAMPFKLTSLIGSADITDFSQNLNVGSATGMEITGTLPSSMFVRDAVPYANANADADGGFSGEAFETGGFEGGEMANGALNGLSIGVPSVLPVRYNFVATDDPNVWNHIGVIEFSFGNDPDWDATSQASSERQNNWSSAKDAVADMRNNFTDGKDGLNSDWKGGFNGSVSITGYVEGTATYDPVSKEWKNEFDGGGLVVAGSAGYVWSGNSVVGVVPFTYSIGAGADLEVALEFSPMSEEKQEGGANIYTDFLSTVKFVVWAKAFAGVGFDFDIIAAKIGIFGQMDAGINVKTLNQAYLAQDINTSYNYFEVGGEIGLKVELKLLIFEYEKVLVSGKLDYHRTDKIDGRPEYTVENMPDKIYESYQDDDASIPERPENSLRSASARSLSLLDMANMQVAATRLKTESREYLKEPTLWADPYGIRPFSLDADNAFEAIGTNVYPGSEPEIARDGSLVVFRTDNGSADLNETAVGWALQVGNTYVKQDGTISGTIENSQGKQVQTPATNLDFDGTADFGVAAWEQQSEESPVAADSAMDLAMVNDLMKRTEILVSVKTPEGWSEPYRLTTNSVSDMAPEVAVNDAGQAVVAWRQPAAASGADPTTFDASDEIVYSYYDSGIWSEVRQLDLGDLGSVKGFDVAMAADGTALVTSAIQTAGPSSVLGVEGAVNAATNGSSEITYRMIDGEGRLMGERIRLTNDAAADENPQAAYADGRFLLAWYSSEELAATDPITDAYETRTVNDIKLRSINLDGSIDSSFVNSVSAINKTRTLEVAPDFTLAQGADGSLDELALIFTTSEESEASGTGSVMVYDKDVVQAIKFIKAADGRVQVTAPQELADMGDATTADHVSAYVNGNTIKAVILKSSPTGETETYQPDMAEGAEGSPDVTNPAVTLAATQSSMVSATLECKDSISVEDIVFENDDIRVNSSMPVQFTVLNTGLTPITSITAAVGGESVTVDDLYLLPNDVQNVYVDCAQGASIEDRDYTITAAFAGGNTASAEGTLKLTLPDVSIGAVKVLEELEGERTLSVSLYNDSDVPLSGAASGSGGGSDSQDGRYAVVLNFYDEQSEDAAPLPISCTIEDAGALTLMDEKGYAKQVTYTIPEEFLDENGEIPELGVNLYIEAQVVDRATGEVVQETGYEYNNETVKFQSLYKDGVQFQTDAILDNSGEVSKAVVTVKNLSMNPASEQGNVLVSLLDATGNVLETVSLAGSQGELFNLDGEAKEERTVSFTKKGYSVTTQYLPVADGNAYNNELLLLEAGGRSFDKEALKLDENENYTLSLSADTVNQSSTLLTAVSQSPEALLTVTDSQGEKLAEGMGYVTFTLPLTYGENGETVANAFTVSVRPEAEYAETGSYQLTVNNRRESSGKLLLTTSAQTATGWTNQEEVTVSLSASELSGFVPVDWQYNVNNQGWTDAEAVGAQSNTGETAGAQPGTDETAGTQTDARLLTVLTEEGEHVVQGRILDAEGYAMSSDRTIVKIDRVNPVIDTDSVTLIETADPLEEPGGVVGFFRNLLGLDSDGNTENQLKVRLAATDDRSGIYQVVIKAGEQEYRMTRLEGTDIYEGVVTEPYRGSLALIATDLAGNMDVYTTEDLVIEKLKEPVLRDTEYTINAESATLVSGFEGTDIAEYGIQYRKKGDTKWLTAEPEKGSNGNDFTFVLEGLSPNTAYEYQFYQRQVTKSEITWHEVKEFTTKVKILTPELAEGSCKKDTVTADKTQAWPGETVTYTLTSCEEHTPSGLLAGGEEFILENTESQTHTVTYTVKETDVEVSAEGTFAEKQLSRVEEVPTVTLYEEDSQLKSAEALKAYLDGLKDITVVYDNGTVDQEYQAVWSRAQDQAWSAAVGTYLYETTITLRSGEETFLRTVSIRPEEERPKTGDNGYVEIYAGLLVGAATALGALAIIQAKRRRKQR